MSRASQASSSTARLSLATGINGTEASTSTTPSGNTLGVRQRIERVPSQSLLVTPTSNHVKKRPSREAGYGSLKGKEKENVSTSARTHGPSRRKWEVGSRGWVKEGFRQFGEHCARNQIRTLLIDCLVMTNLFYPSLAIYLLKRNPGSSSQRYYPQHFPENHAKLVHNQRETHHPLSLLNRPLQDTFFPYPAPLLPRLSWAGWWGGGTQEGIHDGWIASRVTDAHRLLGVEDEEVRLLRMSWGDVGELVNAMSANDEWSERDFGVLQAFRQVVEGWEAIHSGEGCVRQLQYSGGDTTERIGPCYLLSGGHPPQTDIININDLGSSTNHSTTLRPNTESRSVAALMRTTRASSKTFEARWAESQEDLAATLGGDFMAEPLGWRGGVEDLSGSFRLSFSAIPEDTIPASSDASEEDSDHVRNRFRHFIGLIYLAMVAFAGWQVSFATRVHSRIGLAVTGIVQVLISAVMSLSVLALIGWNGWGWSTMPSSVPLWSLPMVVVVVGVENMSHLTRAVFSIPFHYSVPERIGLALSKVGTRIAYTSLTNILLLALIWLLVDVTSVQEFCVFVIVVNITDWFMLHTFYLTVLSIDAQRLELADVLANVSPQPVSRSPGEDEKVNRTFSWRDSLAARSLRSGTLILTLSCVAVMYYLSDRTPSSAATALRLARSSQAAMPYATPFVTPADGLAGLSIAEKLWRSLNPQGWPFIRLTVPAASIVILPKPGNLMSPSDLRKLAQPMGRSILPRLVPLWYFFKVVILPQAITAGSLYGLLLYLLKNADQLDAQRNRLGRGEESTSDEGTEATSEGRNRLSPINQLQGHVLPCSHTSDIDIISSSQDGSVSLSIALDNSVFLWRFSDAASGTREKLSVVCGAEDQIVGGCVDNVGRYVAVAISNGTVQSWRIDTSSVQSLDVRRVPDDSGRIRAISFFTQNADNEDPFDLEAAGPDVPSMLVVTSSTAFSFDPAGEISLVVPPDDLHHRISIVSVPNSDTCLLLAAGQYRDALYRKTGSEWESIPLSSQCHPGDLISAVSSLRIASNGAELIAAGRRSGLVEVFDDSGACIASVGPTPVSPIKAVDLAFPPSTKSTGCGTVSGDGFFIISSVSDQVFVDRAILPGVVFCRCIPRRSPDEQSRTHTPNDLDRPMASLVIPPSSLRAKTTPGNSPRKSPSLLPPVSNGEFPLSSHGTRRLSAYHNHDGSVSTPDKASTPGLRVGLTPLLDHSSPNGSSTDAMQPPWADMEIVPLGSISLASGKWKLVDNLLICLSRAGQAIGDDGWDVCVVDLGRPYNGEHLIVTSCNLSELEKRTRSGPFSSLSPQNDNVSSRARSAIPPQGNVGTNVSMKDQRAERLLSLSGRASFPSLLGNSSSTVPTFAPMAYVELGPLERVGEGESALGGRLLVGLGNRVGLIYLDQDIGKGQEKQDGGSSRSKWLGMGLGRSAGTGMALGGGGSAPGGARLKGPPRRVSDDKKGI